MATSITGALGAGSGIDIKSLVTQLVDAQYAARTEQITTKQESLTAQISAVSQLKGGISGFSNALTALVKGGTLATQPSSSNPGAVKATTINGAKLGALSTRVTVGALAAGQVAATDRIADNTVFGAGSFTLQFGTASFDGDGAMTLSDAGNPITVPITKADATLDDIATAINGTNTGITASVIADGTGERLMLRGPTGAGRAFTLTSNDSGLSALNVTGTSGGAAVQVKAQNARVTLDGVTFERGSNAVSDLIPGVKLELLDTTTAPVTLTAAPATSNLVQAVSDVVETYNNLVATLKTATDPVTGSLRNDPAVATLQRKLQALTLTKLLPDDGSGAPRTLAEIGVRTNRDGTLSVDQTTLLKASIDHPEALGAMFADGTGASEHGLAAALAAISTDATSASFGLGASETRYGKAAADLSTQQTRATADAEITRARLTRQFASMDARVAAYKSTQTFLQQQVDAWNADS